MSTYRSHADVRSYYFREAIADVQYADEALPLTWSQARHEWRKADAKAKEWRRQATNRFNHQTQRWEQGQ
jgi:hypothetical protein